MIGFCAPPGVSCCSAERSAHSRLLRLRHRQFTSASRSLPALQNNPRLKNLTEQQRLDRLEFVMGNTLFALLQMGHVAIDEMNLPVLGREEDEADAFAALRLLRIGSDFSQRVLAEASKNWFLAARRDQETGAEPVYYGEHSLGEQRAFHVVCLMGGRWL